MASFRPTMADLYPEDEDTARSNINEDIDPDNEVRGMKLIIIHLAICLCTFLVGLVSTNSVDSKLAC